MQTESPETYNEAMISEQIHKLKSDMALGWVKNQNSETLFALRKNAFSKPLKRMTFDSDLKYDGELSTTAGSEDTSSDSGFDTPTTSPNSPVKSFDLSPTQELRQNSRPEFLFENTLSFIENIKAKAPVSQEQIQVVEEEHQGVLTYFIAHQKLFKLVPRETLLAIMVVILASKIALPGEHIKNFFQNCEHLSRFNRLSEIKSEKAYRMLSRLKEKVSFSPNF
jgi:hypothetical protein